MQSIRSKLFIWLIKNRHLLKLKLRDDTFDSSFSAALYRENIEKTAARFKMPKGVTVQKEKVGNLNAEWIIPERPVNDKVLLYIHGGGFISGSCNTHRTHVAKFASGSGLKSLLFDYSLAPEHPFPAGLEDCVKAYKWLLEKGYAPEDIVAGGESAGGTLTLSLLLALKEQTISLPKAVFSISPVTDLRCLADSFSYNAGKDIAPLGSWDVMTRCYIGENDPAQPLLSPHFGNFTGLPPLHICVGTHEIHLDDCENTARKAEEQGVEVILSKWPGMVHAFPILSPLFPEAKKAMAEICEFIKCHASQ